MCGRVLCSPGPVYHTHHLLPPPLPPPTPLPSPPLPCRPPLQVNPLQAHHHADEGFALDWSRVRPARLASGDCKKHIHVWEPQEGGRWQVGLGRGRRAGGRTVESVAVGAEPCSWGPAQAYHASSLCTTGSLASRKAWGRWLGTKVGVASAACSPVV